MLKAEVDSAEIHREEYSSSSNSRLVRGGNRDSHTAANLTRLHREYLNQKNYARITAYVQCAGSKNRTFRYAL